jgi:pteridine reductase
MPKPRPVALVTGGAHRVGRQIALALAESGYDLLIHYNRNKGEANKTAKQIAAQGGRALAVQADLTDPPAAALTLGKAVAEQFGRLDVLVNNASIYEPRDLAGTDMAIMRRMWAVHVEAPLLLCQRFEKDLRSTRGHVVNMVDAMIERPWPKYLAYCASKAALWNLTLGLARELAPQITVNGIAPGVIQWPDDYPRAEREKYLRRVPLARAGTPRDAAGAVLFFCTTGSYVTGQILRLDGGRSLT